MDDGDLPAIRALEALLQDLEATLGVSDADDNGLQMAIEITRQHLLRLSLRFRRIGYMY